MAMTKAEKLTLSHLQRENQELRTQLEILNGKTPQSSVAFTRYEWASEKLFYLPERTRIRFWCGPNSDELDVFYGVQSQHGPEPKLHVQTHGRPLIIRPIVSNSVEIEIDPA